MRIGRPRILPVNLLKVGGTSTFPWRYFDSYKNRPIKPDLLYAIIRQERRRYGKRFKCIRTIAGLRVTRLM